MLLLVVGEMAGARLRSFLSPGSTASSEESISESSLVQQARPIAPANAATLTLSFAKNTRPGNLVTVEIYAGSVHSVSVSGMGCSLWTVVDSDDVTGVGLAALYACNVVTPGSTVTISLPTPGVVGAVGQEFSGYQVNGYQSGHNSNSSTTSVQNSLSIRNPNGLLLILMALSSNFTVREITAPAAPWSMLNSVDGANNLTFAQSYQFVNSVGTYNGIWSWPTSSAVVVVGGAFPQLAPSPTETPDDALAPSGTSD